MTAAVAIGFRSSSCWALEKGEEKCCLIHKDNFFLFLALFALCSALPCPGRYRFQLFCETTSHNLSFLWSFTRVSSFILQSTWHFFWGDTIISPQSYESIKDLELGLNFHPFYEGFLRISHKVTQVRAFPIKTLMMSKSAYSWERANLNPGWFLLPFTTCISSLQYWSFTSSWFRLAESSMHKNSSGSFHHLAASHGFYNNVEEYCHFHAKM